jgi:hypothetical protein
MKERDYTGISEVEGLDKDNIKMDPKETRFVHVTDVIWLRIGPNKHDSEPSIS